MKLKQKSAIFFLVFSMIFAATGAAPVSQFGATGDGVADDSEAIQKAFDSGEDLTFEKKIYLLAKPLTLKGQKNIRIDFGSATLVKQNREEYTVKIAECNNIRLSGGTFVIGSAENPEIPEMYAKSVNAHTFMITSSENITLRDAYISGSGQMGICAMDCIGLIFEGNIIENCFRDGIYSHYCADVRYLYNRLKNIKDDALSFHDYGRGGKKITAAGYRQAGNFIATGNTVHSAYQGIATIGSIGVTITNNFIDSTVNAGICVFNSDRVFKGSKAQVAEVVIANNMIVNAGKTTRIITKEYKNGLDTCTARAAICAQAQGMDHLMPTATRRLSNIIISGNIIRECGTQGIQGHFVDNLSIIGNQVENCNSSGKASTQNIIETVYCSNVQLMNNTVTDTRQKPLHGRGWSLRESTGTENGSQVKGFNIEAGTASEKAPANWQH